MAPDFCSPPLTRRGFAATLLAGGLGCVAVHRTFAAEAAAEYKPQAGENEVGFRHSTLDYVGSDKKDRKREVLLWYPSADPAAKHNYRVPLAGRDLALQRDLNLPKEVQPGRQDLRST